MAFTIYLKKKNESPLITVKTVNTQGEAKRDAELLMDSLKDKFDWIVQIKETSGDG